MIMKKRVLLFIVSLLSLSMVTIVYADYGINHIAKGNHRGDSNSFTYYKDSSVSSYGYTGAVDNAASEWSKASGNIQFSTTSDDDCTSCVVVYVGEHVLGSGTYGAADYWDEGWLGIGWVNVSVDDKNNGTNFDRVRIRLDHGEMEDAGYTSSQSKHNAGHEFGHALSLNHFENWPAHSGNHWMRSGQISLSRPTSTDIDHLTEKWGD